MSIIFIMFIQYLRRGYMIYKGNNCSCKCDDKSIYCIKKSYIDSVVLIIFILK